MKWFAVFIFVVSAPTAFASVVINEIAWMGTVDSSTNEWIELANSGGAVDLTGWILRIEGKKDIALSGSISAGEYYLIERTDDSTVPNIPADLATSFGTGLSNDGALLILLDSSGAEVDRINGSDAWKIGGEIVGNNTTKEPASRTGSGWATRPATPRAENSGASHTEYVAPVSNTEPASGTPSTLASFPVEPQIFADAGPSSRVVLVGAPTTFSGIVWGIKKEPIENARMVWGFGDGGITEGKTVIHTFYYPGDYTIVLDASSGYYTASDRVYITAITPNFNIRTGGDSTRSFIAIENKTSNELDLSGWQVSANGKTFILPKNTILGARKTLVLPSEITKLVSPEGITPELFFPNGFPVKPDTINQASFPVEKIQKYSTPADAQVLHTTPLASNTQHVASVATAVSGSNEITLDQNSKKESKTLWYGGVALLGVLALLAIRATKKEDTVNEEEDQDLTADDFEITEEE